MSLAVLRPRTRVVTLSLLPLAGGVWEIPLAGVVAVWLAIEVLAVVTW